MSVAESEWSLLVAQNLVPGLIAIVLTGVLIRVWQRLKNAYIERKYPIGGTYVSTFVDSKADERDSDIYQNTEHYTAVTELEQRGTSISGVS